MSGVTGNWALMGLESDKVFCRDFRWVALGFTICVIQLNEQKIMDKICLSSNLPKNLNIPGKSIENCRTVYIRFWQNNANSSLTLTDIFLNKLLKCIEGIFMLYLLKRIIKKGQSLSKNKLHP